MEEIQFLHGSHRYDTFTILIIRLIYYIILIYIQDVLLALADVYGPTCILEKKKTAALSCIKHLTQF